MYRDDLSCAVADVTGESVAVIDHLGFQIYDPFDDDDNETLVLDCPFCGGTVLLSTTGPEALPEVAECVRCDTLFDYQEHEIYSRDLFTIDRTEERCLARAA